MFPTDALLEEVQHLSPSHSRRSIGGGSSLPFRLLTEHEGTPPLVFGMFSTPTNARRAREDTFFGVLSCSTCFLHPATHAEHEGTPLLVFGVFSKPTNACRAQEDTIIGVLSCLACFLHPVTHAKHERTSLLVSFRARRLFYIHQWTPNTRRHPCWCRFVLCAYPASARALPLHLIVFVYYYRLN